MIPKIGETYRFDLPSGDSYTGEVDETNGRYVNLRPGASCWLVEEKMPHTTPADCFVHVSIDDPRVLIYDADGELV